MVAACYLICVRDSIRPHDNIILYLRDVSFLLLHPDETSLHSRGLYRSIIKDLFQVFSAAEGLLCVCVRARVCLVNLPEYIISLQSEELVVKDEVRFG